MNILFYVLRHYSSITPEQCKRRGAVLVLTVMDHDYVFQNDFAGEVYIQLCDIPGINGEDVSGYESISFMTKPLIHPKPKGLYSFDHNYIFANNYM